LLADDRAEVMEDSDLLADDTNEAAEVMDGGLLAETRLRRKK
jgi:hypothetical protein